MSNQAAFAVRVGKARKIPARKVAKELCLEISETPSAALRKAVRESRKELPKLLKKPGHSLADMFKKLEA